MKSLLLLVAFFCVLSFRIDAQTSRYSIANGEYSNFILDNSTQILYGIGASSIGQGSGSNPYGFAYACKFPVANTKIKFVAAGLHTAACIDVSGNVYFTGPNEDGTMGNGTTSGISYYFVPVTTDINGNPFTHVKYIRMSSSYFTGGAGYGALIYAIKDDGTLWVWGNTQGGYSGDGTYGKVVTRPTQVTSFPAGTVITKVIMANIAMALDANGNVWTWAGNGSPVMIGNSSQTDYMRPHTITLPSKAIDIAGGSYFSYALLDNHSLYGWGLFVGYLGVGKNPASVMWGTNPPAKPMLLDTSLNLPAKINRLSTNTATTYAILTDGSLWAWGGSECGQVGNGQELDYKRYTINPAPYGGSIPEPYAWNQDLNSVQLQQHKPVNIAPGMNNFTDLSEGVEMVFYKYAVDANGQLYSWGRNKVGVLGNGFYEGDYINGMLGSIYPNSWDVPYVTAINPFVTGGKTILATSPICLQNPGANYCNLYVNPANTPPKSLINGVKNGTSGITGSSTSLDGTLSTDNVAIMSYVWTQVSGPNSAIISIPSGKKVNVLGLATGTYVFKLKVTDNGWASDSTTFTVNVNTGAAQPPVANAGTKQSITLPANSVMLTGSGSEVNGTIVSYKWAQQSGPGTATIAAPATATTAVAGLIAGTYVFALTVTDNAGKTAVATVQITVNAALVTPPPVAGLAIPGKIEAESFNAMSGVITETTTDVGGGLNVGAIDQTDWMNYNVNVATAGTYTVSLRIATVAAGAGFQLRSSSGTVLATVTLPNTGNYQAWQTVTTSVTLPAGAQTLQLYSTSTAHWNINWMQFVSPQAIPGKIEAESFNAMSGVITETTTDAGGGLNVGAIDQNDWMNYNVNVAAAGTYTVSFRVATVAAGAGFQLRSSSGTVLATVTLPNTGNYQAWQTVTASVTLPAGVQTLQLYSTSTAHWNINWMQFASGTTAASSAKNVVTASRESLLSDSTSLLNTASSFVLYPNPVQGQFMIQLNNGHMGNMQVQIVDAAGVVRQVYSYNKNQSSMQLNLSAGNLSAGVYFVRVQIGAWSEIKKIVKL
jgi:alpha-tubulin suppressor-like RCC1 family protein